MNASTSPPASPSSVSAANTVIAPPTRTHGVLSVALHEWKRYWQTSLPLVFIAVFLLLVGLFTFYLGRFFERNQADLLSMFRYMPWLLMIMIPALAIRTWAEDRAGGTMEMLLSLPLHTWQLVFGKYLGANALMILALAPTTILWLTVSYLGNPDHGVIFMGYFGTYLIGSGFLALTMIVSALTNNQTVAFVLSTLLCFTFSAFGTPLLINAVDTIFPNDVAVFIASLSVLLHFQPMADGLLRLQDIIFFFSLIFSALCLNILIISNYRR